MNLIIQLKKYVPLCLLILLSAIRPFVSSAQSPGWEWAVSVGGDKDDVASKIATDSSGYIYVIGHYSSTVLTLGSINLTNSGGNDIFLVKYDSSGTVLWAQGIANSSGNSGYSIALDKKGNVLLTGSFYGSIKFGTIILNNTTRGSDVFIVKYDPSGKVIWAKRSTGGLDDCGYAIATDLDGNVFVTGTFRSTKISFGTFTLTNSNPEPLFESQDVFIVKYDSLGNVLWARNGGGMENDFGIGISCNSKGEVYVTGSFESPSIAFGAVTSSNNGYFDLFIAKFNFSGNLMWLKTAGGRNKDIPTDIRTDTFGNAVIAGLFSSPSITFGSSILNKETPSGDIFVVKYDSSGKVDWAKSIGGTSYQYCNSIATDNGGNIYIVGEFHNSIRIGDITLYGYKDIRHMNSNDMYIAKFNQTGDIIWAKSMGGGISYDYCNSIATDNSGNIFVAGTFASPTISFGAISLNKKAGQNGFKNDMFLAKIKDITLRNDNKEIGLNNSLYPNPSSGKFAIKSSNIQRIEIFNLLGEKIFSAINSNLNTEFVIDISEYPKNMYLVKIYDQNTFYNRKILVQ